MVHLALPKLNPTCTILQSPGEVVAPIQRLLEVRFGSRLRADPPKEMQLCSMWVLLAFFPEPLDLIR